MLIPSPLRDHLFVYVDAKSLDRTESGIYIPDWQPGDKDAVKAEVVAVPVGLSRERPLDYPGLDGRAYVYADLVDLPRVGETVYLKPNTFSPDLEYPDKPGVFLIALDRVVAVASPDGLRPFQGLLLCKEVYDKGVERREDGVYERVEYRNFLPEPLPVRVVTELHPLPEPFTLRVLHTGPPLRGQEDTVAVGDVIVAHKMLFAYHAVKQKDDEEVSERWMHEAPKITIEGKEYAYVPRQCVMGKRETLVFNAPLKIDREQVLAARNNALSRLSQIIFQEAGPQAYDGPKTARFHTDEWATQQRTDEA